MTSSAFDFKDLLQLVELIKASSQFSEFKLRANGFELELRRGPAATEVVPPVPAAAPAATEVAAQPHPAAVLDGPPGIPAGACAVTAPMVGTVYLSPSPGAAVFAQVGQVVAADTTLCIVEVMKLMSSVAAGRAGTVTQVLVVDAQAVEFGQTMFVISPS